MSWYHNLSARERYLVIGMGALLALFVIWQFAIKPVYRFKADAQRAQSAAMRDYNIVSTQGHVLAKGNANSDKTRSEFNRAGLLGAAQLRQLSISRLNPEKDGGFKVWFDDASSLDIMHMLQNLSENYNVQITRVQMSRLDSGLVSAQISLQPAG